jgi:hypothetical protein
MEVACTPKRNFDRECKKTFATKSAQSRSDRAGPNGKLVPKY